jgi:hypothetical protein
MRLLGRSIDSMRLLGRSVDSMRLLGRSIDSVRLLGRSFRLYAPARLTVLLIQYAFKAKFVLFYFVLFNVSVLT